MAPIEPAENLKLKPGLNSGEARLSFSKVRGSKSNAYQCTPDPLTDDSVWQSEMGTISKHTFTGLESGKRYWFRVMTVGINGQCVYSAAISTIIL